MSDIPLEQYRKKSQTDSVNQQDRANSQVIFQALFQLMLEQGYEQANFQKISKITGISRTTLYRRWASIDDLLLDAIADKVPSAIILESCADPIFELRHVFVQLADFLKSPLGHAVLQATIRLQDQHSLEKRQDLWDIRYQQIVQIFLKLKPAPHTTDLAKLHSVVSMALGSFYFQIFVQKAEVTDVFIDSILNNTLLLIQQI